VNVARWELEKAPVKVQAAVGFSYGSNHRHQAVAVIAAAPV